MTIRAFQPRVAGEFGSDPPGQGQGLAVDSGGDPVAGVEVPRFARGAQLQLRPCGRAGWRRRSGGSGAGGRPGAAEAAHARQRQLPVAGGTEVFRRDPAPACGGDAGLQPAQPAVPFLDRDDPPAAGALAAAIAAGEVIAGPAVRLRAVGGSPGQAVRAAADRGGGPDPARPSGGRERAPVTAPGRDSGPGLRGRPRPARRAARRPAGRSCRARGSAAPPPRSPPRRR